MMIKENTRRTVPQLLYIVVGSFVGSFLAVRLTLSNHSTGIWGGGNSALIYRERRPRPPERTTIVATNNAGPLYGCESPIKRGVPPFKLREELGAIVQSEKMTRGAELGVQRGIFSSSILGSWPNVEEYLLVDLWDQQDNYQDSANIRKRAQESNFKKTLKATNEWSDVRRICRNYTSSCVDYEEDEYFDFIYVDARHDFKGVYEDLAAWWPKLKVGGIFAGHDYVTQDDGPKQGRQDWTVNYDGTIDETGTVVKGAVDKFAAEVCRQVTVSYREKTWNTWAIRK